MHQQCMAHAPEIRQKYSLKSTMNNMSVTQEKSFALGSVDEHCGGTYRPCQKIQGFNSV